jgi:hypothetical protein
MVMIMVQARIALLGIYLLEIRNRVKHVRINHSKLVSNCVHLKYLTLFMKVKVKLSL